MFLTVSACCGYVQGVPPRRGPVTEVAQPPADATLDDLRAAAAGCTACELHADATQTVFGEGPARARVVMVGEQPGDKEDRAGQPFVGPAGRELDRALTEAGIDRTQVYVTNAVKHFRFERRGSSSFRLHKTPSAGQVKACFPWLRAELADVAPDLVVALGATAAKALQGAAFRITVSRGQLLDWNGTPFLATAHPSSVLRADDPDAAHAALVDDLRVAAGVLH
jgi:uracil-DNA glycosylase